MALSTSSQFQYFQMSFDSFWGHVASIYYRLVGETSYRIISFAVQNGTVAITQGSAELDILRDIYASAGGFRDSNDDALVPGLSQFRHGDTIESLEEYGEWKPP